MGMSMGLDIDQADIERLVKDHKKELMKKELAELQSQPQEVLVEQCSTEEEKGRG